MVGMHVEEGVQIALCVQSTHHMLNLHIYRVFENALKKTRRTTNKQSSNHWKDRKETNLRLMPLRVDLSSRRESRILEQSGDDVSCSLRERICTRRLVSLVMRSMFFMLRRRWTWILFTRLTMSNASSSHRCLKSAGCSNGVTPCS